MLNQSAWLSDRELQDISDPEANLTQVVKLPALVNFRMFCQ